MQSLKFFASSLLLVVLSGCAGLPMQVPDFQPNVTLPASGDCYGITVVTRKETRLPKPECDELKKRAVFFDSENYKLIRESFQQNCQLFQCQQLIGAFDNLFLAIDKGLQSIPAPQ